MAKLKNIMEKHGGKIGKIENCYGMMGSEM